MFGVKGYVYTSNIYIIYISLAGDTHGIPTTICHHLGVFSIGLKSHNRAFALYKRIYFDFGVLSVDCS